MTMLPMPGALGEQFQVPQIDSPQIQMPQAKPKGGMFGGGGKFGIKEAIAFGLAGLVARRNPMLLQGLMGGMMQKQNSQREDEQYQQRRNDGMEDWIAQQSWKLANEQPDQTGYAKDLIAAGIQPGTPQFQQLYGQYVQSKAATGGGLGALFKDPATGQNYQLPQQPLPQTLSDADWNAGGPAAPPPASFPRSF
jgi:hypothetical protein